MTGSGTIGLVTIRYDSLHDFGYDGPFQSCRAYRIDRCMTGERIATGGAAVLVGQIEGMGSCRDRRFQPENIVGFQPAIGG
jgi:hypothetical protein